MDAPTRCRRIAAAAAAVAMALVPGAVGAQGQSCIVSSWVDIVFGDYDPFAAAPLDSAGSITHRCPPNRPPRISLDRGGSASFAPREMRFGAEVLRYNLYLDAACTMIWGDGSAGTHEYVAATGRATVPVYGRVFPLQDPIIGAYTDTITVTVQF